MLFSNFAAGSHQTCVWQALKRALWDDEVFNQVKLPVELCQEPTPVAAASVRHEWGLACPHVPDSRACPSSLVCPTTCRFAHALEDLAVEVEEQWEGLTLCCPGEKDVLQAKLVVAGFAEAVFHLPIVGCATAH